MKRNLYIISKEDKERIHHACFQIKNDKIVKVTLDDGILVLKQNKKKIDCFIETKKRGAEPERKKLFSTDNQASLEQDLTEALSKKEEVRVGDSKTKAKKKYRKKTYDTCTLYYPKGELKKLDKAIKGLGYESRNEFMRKAADEKIKRESKKSK